MFASQPCLPYSSAQSCPSVSLTEDDDDDGVDDDDDGGDILAVNE